MRYCLGAFLVGAALLAAATPASASLIGNNVTIKRVQGGNFVYKEVNTTVGAGAEYSDNFFDIDVTENKILFDGGNFSIGSIFYAIDGLDFDNNPLTANVVHDFSWIQIFGSTWGPNRLTIEGDGTLILDFTNTTGGASAAAEITLGAAAPVETPEPAALGLLGLGIVGLAGARRRKA